MRIRLVLLSLGAAISAAFAMTAEEWPRSKALQSCFGEEVMSKYEGMRMAAMAKCAGMEPPEVLKGPLFQSPMNFIQSLLESAQSQASIAMTDFDLPPEAIQEVLGDAVIGLDEPIMMETPGDNADFDPQLSAPGPMLRNLPMIQGMGKMGPQGSQKPMRGNWASFMDNFIKETGMDGPSDGEYVPVMQHPKSRYGYGNEYQPSFGRPEEYQSSGPIQGMLGDTVMGLDGPAMMEAPGDNADLDLPLSVLRKVLLRGLSMNKGRGKMGPYGPPKPMRGDWAPLMDNFMRGSGMEQPSEGLYLPLMQHPTSRYGYSDEYTSPFGGPEAYHGTMTNVDDGIGDLIDAVIALAMAKNRNKRAADATEEMVALEKALAAKLEILQSQMVADMGNMTCMMQEMKLLDAQGNLDLEGELEMIDSLGIKDQWLANKTELVARSCYASAMALPKEFHRLSYMNEKYGRLCTFMGCNDEAVMEVCMNLDVKRQLEKNFGSISKLVKDTGMDEGSLLTLARQVFSENGKIYGSPGKQKSQGLGGGERKDVDLN